MKDRELFHAMDACRPGSDDLKLPEMRGLKARLEADAKWRQAFRQIEQIDNSLRGQLTEVPIPDALRERVLIALGPADVDRPTRVSQSPSVTHSGDSADAAAGPRTRRRMVAALGLAATAACLLLALYALTRPSTEPLDARQLAGWAINRWSPDLTAWTDYDAASANDLYPPSRFLRTTPTRWQRLRTHLDRRTVVFEIPSTGTSKVRLYALRAPRRLSQLPTRPPERPLVGSGGWQTAAWQETPHLYVLTIKDSPQDYFEILRSRPPSLARRDMRPEAGPCAGRQLPVLRLTQPTRPSRG